MLVASSPDKGFNVVALFAGVGGAVTLLAVLGLMRRKVGPMRPGKSRAVRR